MQEMLYPASYIKSKGLGKVCALLTDGRFSGGTSKSRPGKVSSALKTCAKLVTSADKGAVRDLSLLD